MVGTMMAELHLDGLGAAGESQQLMAEANTENGHPALEDLLNRLDGIVARLRVPRTVGKKNTVG